MTITLKSNGCGSNKMLFFVGLLHRNNGNILNITCLKCNTTTKATAVIPIALTIIAADNEDTMGLETIENVKC